MLQIFIGVDSTSVLPSASLYPGASLEPITGDYLSYRGSISIDDAVEERAAMTCTIIDIANEYTFSEGQQINVYDGTTCEFSGIITKAQKKRAGGAAMLHQLTCADWHYLADKRIVAEAYENTAAGTIVADIITTYLADEGVTTGSISTGPTLEQAVFNYVKASDALASLAEKCGYTWYIDVDKKLYFIPRTTYTAPFTVTNTDMVKGSVSVTKGSPTYRNRQYVRGGKDLTSEQTQTFKGDGELQQFVVGYPVAKVPTITLNAAAQTVGIRGVDTGKNWYWSKGSNVISQESSDTKLTTSDTLSVTYYGEFDIVIMSRDSTAILARKTIEGAGTGYVDDVMDDPHINSRDAAFELANAKIEKFAQNSTSVKFTTFQKGLAPGQLLTITLSEYGINAEEFLIQSVSTTTEESSVMYTVNAISGPNYGTWTNFFYQLANKGQTFVVRENIDENQVLITVEDFYKTWTDSESPNIFIEYFPGAATFPGASTIAAFEHDQRVTHLAWYVGGVEAGRKAITQQSGTDEIFTLTYLDSFEANVAISHFGWYGGMRATDAVGTGVEVDKQVFGLTKTTLEAYQVEKTDTKWS